MYLMANDVYSESVRAIRAHCHSAYGSSRRAGGSSRFFSKKVPVCTGASVRRARVELSNPALFAMSPESSGVMRTTRRRRQVVGKEAPMIYIVPG